MKKTLFIIGFVLACLVSYGQTDTSTIMKFDQTIVEEFKSVDQDGQPVTSYRRVDQKEIKSYIDKIKYDIDAKQGSLEMLKDEERMYNSMLDDLKVRRAQLQAAIQENKRRIEVYKTYLR